MFAHHPADVRMGLARDRDQTGRAFAENIRRLGGSACTCQPRRDVICKRDSSKVSANRQQERLCSQCVTAAVFKLNSRMVDCGQLADIALGLHRPSGGPKEMSFDAGVSFGQCFDHFGMNAKRDNKRMLATPLKRMRLARTQEDHVSFVQCIGAVGQMVPYLAILHPKQLIKVVIVQRSWTCRGKRCTGQSDFCAV